MSVLPVVAQAFSGTEIFTILHPRSPHAGTASTCRSTPGQERRIPKPGREEQAPVSPSPATDASKMARPKEQIAAKQIVRHEPWRHEC